MRGRARGGDCDFAVSPKLNATETPVFWLPQDDTGAVILAPAPPVLSNSSAPAGFLNSDHMRVTPEANHLLHSLGDGQNVHLVLAAGASADTPLAALVPLGPDGFGRVDAILRLLSSLCGRKPPLDTRLTDQQRARARRMLQAFDGRRAGATQQEIAEVIFKTGTLNRDEWQAASERHAVMSLLKGAREMIAGGYRKLLRHRRR